MLKLYTKRQDRATWLETHIWHAKRFHMEELYGFKIPVRCTEKFTRAAYRYAKYSSSVIDLSYLRVIQLTAPASLLLDFLTAHGWD